MEKRLLLAFVLSAAILFAWSVIFPPPQRTQPAPVPAAAYDTAAPQPAAEEAAVEIQDQDTAAPAPETTDEVFSAAVEAEVTLANDDVTVVLTNRGAAVSSYRLASYDNDDGNPVNLVQNVPLPERSLPLQLVTAAGPDNELYQVEENGNGVVFRWADGRGNSVVKRLALAADGFGIDVEIDTAGTRASDVISVGTGMRNLSSEESDSRLALWGEGIVMADGEVERFKRRKIKDTRALTAGGFAYVGFEDAYFLSILRPETALSQVSIRAIEFGGDDEKPDHVLEITVAPARGVLRGELLGAPKDYDLLQSIGGGLEETLDFGIFAPISVFFLKALRWIYGHVGNYGVAIILLTLGIRILLFPLMHTSTVSMRKMAKVQPKVKEIQAKFKKKKTDPQARAKMNQEMMALYKQEGVNPMAGCLPLLVQLPLLWALYQLFLKAIELRHEPFMLWITDLSAKDPLYVTPILMTATMWLQQRLAPQAGDPQQQKLMRMMPLIFGIMFLQFPAGLVLYWLANNVITIIQQEITLHIVGERKIGGRKRSPGKDLKK